MPPCYRGLYPAHSHIKPPCSPPDDPNPPIHLPPHRQILRELPRAPKPFIHNTGNYTLEDLHRQYTKYRHKRINP